MNTLLIACLALQATPAVENVGLSLDPKSISALHRSGPFTVWITPEFFEGQDLDGDGNTVGAVLFVRDDRTGGATNVGWTMGRSVFTGSFGFVSRYGLQVEGDFVAAGVVTDPDQAGSFAPESYLRLLHLPTGTVLDTGFRAPIDGPGIGPNRPWIIGQQDGVCAFVVHEELNGDLNGDGDALDHVTFVACVEGCRVENTGLAASTKPPAGSPATVYADVETGALLLPVDEAGQGGRDLNGDGDAADRVIHVIDLEAGTAQNLGVAGQAFVGSRDSGLLLVDEWQEGRDLNGDGADDDLVYHALDPDTLELRNLRLTPLGGFDPTLGTHAVNDALVVLSTPSSGVPTPLLWLPERRLLVASGAPGRPVGAWLDPATERPLVFLAATEEDYGIDADGNGTIGGPIVGVWRPEAGVELIPWAGGAPDGTWGDATSGPYVRIRVSEALQGQDLDGDGQLLSNVAVVRDVRDGSEVAVPEVYSFWGEPGLTGRRLFGASYYDDMFAVDLGSLTVTDLSTRADLCPKFTPSSCLPRPQAYGAGHIAFVVWEAEAGEDLNGDGDQLDRVLHVAR